MNTRSITKDLVQKYGRGNLLDVGAGYGRYRGMLAPLVEKYQSSDAHDTRADFIEDSADLKHTDNSFDTVLCNQTLEHVKDAPGTIRELYRVLKPGGYVIATVPFLFPEHKDPGDFRRYTRDGFAQAFKAAGFTVIECKSYGGLGNVLAEFVRMKTRNPYKPKRSKVVRKVGYWFSKFLDSLDKRLNEAVSDKEIFYANVYVVAQK